MSYNVNSLLMDRLLVRPSETLHFIRNGTNPRVWWSEREIRLGIIPSSSALPVPPLLLLQSRGPSRQMGIPQFLIPTAATATLFIRCRGHLSCRTPVSKTAWIKEYIRAESGEEKNRGMSAGGGAGAGEYGPKRNWK